MPQSSPIYHRMRPFILETGITWNGIFYVSPLVRFVEFLIGAVVAKLALHEDLRVYLTTNRRLTEIGSDVAFAIGALWIRLQRLLY